jgi:hypothetical protein
VRYIIFCLLLTSEEEVEVCVSTCVTDETGISDTDIIVHKAENEMSGPPGYNE